MASSTGQAAPSPSSTPVASAPPPAATTMEPKMEAGLLALACSGSFQDLQSLINGTPAAYTIGSSATRPPALYAVTVGGDTLLHVVAASHGDSEDLLNKANLVYSKAPSLLFVQNSQGDTPLHCAARAGNSPMVSLLIDLANGQGINNAKGLLETQNKLKETALHEAVRFGSNDMVKLLMTHDPELAIFPEEEGTSPLYIAISMENKIVAETLYELSGGVLSYSGPNGRNALHVAVQRSQDLTKMMLDWNSNLMLQGDKNGSTPLHFGIVATQWKIYSQVLTSIPDAMYQQDHDGSFPIHVAASVGAAWVIIDILMKSPNCAELRDARGRTFLHVAVDRMKIGIVDYACRNITLSWILNMQDKDGNTALHLAVGKGSMRIFCSLFGNRQVQLNIMNDKGMTPRDKVEISINEGVGADILVALKYVGTKRGIFHQGFLNEYDTEQARQHEINIMNEVKEGTQSRCIIAVLIATVTFGAIFAMPGGYRADDHANGGTPTLARTNGFGEFIVVITVAFTFSATAVISLVLSGDPTVNLRSRQALFRRSSLIITISVISMMMAFGFGIYTVLAPITHVSALAVFLTLIVIPLYQFWDVVFTRIVLFTALCKRKGIWYGIVWACPLAALSFMNLICMAFLLFVISDNRGKVEPPAQPPTPFA